MIQLKQRKYFFDDNNKLNKGYMHTNDTDNSQTSRYGIYDHTPEIIDNKQQSNKNSKFVMHKKTHKQLQPSLLTCVSMSIIYMFVFYFLNNIPFTSLQLHLLFILTIIISSHLVDIVNIHCLLGRCNSDINEKILIDNESRTNKQLLDSTQTTFGKKVIKILCCIILGLLILYDLPNNTVNYEYYTAQCIALVTILSLYLISKYKIHKFMMLYDNNFANIKAITHDSEVMWNKKNNNPK